MVVGFAAATSLVSFRYHYPEPLRMMSLLWVLNFFVDFAGHITRYFDIKNHWLYNIFFWIQYLSLAFLYYKQIQSGPIHMVIRVFFAAFPLLVLTQCITSGIQDLQTIVVVAGGSFMIFISAAYFRQLYVSDENERITRDPWFWFSFGLIIHFGCTVPFLGMLNYLYKHYPEFTRFYYLYFSNTFTILLNILVIAGFLCRRDYQKSRSF